MQINELIILTAYCHAPSSRYYWNNSLKQRFGGTNPWFEVFLLREMSFSLQSGHKQSDLLLFPSTNLWLQTKHRSNCIALWENTHLLCDYELICIQSWARLSPKHIFTSRTQSKRSKHFLKTSQWNRNCRMKPVTSQVGFSSDPWPASCWQWKQKWASAYHTDAESTRGCVLQGQVQQNGMILPLTLAAHPAK